MTSTRDQEDYLAPRLIGLPALVHAASKHREQGQTIGWTNGCFDILHAGHVYCLCQAKQAVDVLFVGINSDSSVRRLKGPDRPVCSIVDRLLQVRGLRSVDYATVFYTSTVHNILRELRPDKYIKGGDYKPEDVAEWDVVQELGIELQLVPSRPHLSSTRLLAAIDTQS